MVDEMFSNFYKFPEPYRDAIHATVDIKFGWLDRIRILLIGFVSVRATTLCENKPGKVETTSTVIVRGLTDLGLRRQGGGAYIAEGLR